jgi:hypothetical protein
MDSLKKKFIIVFVTCIAVAKHGRGQFNDSVHHYVGYAATGIINETNDGNSFVLNNSLKFNVNKKNKYVNSSAAWTYGRQNGVLTNNDFTGSLDFDVYGMLPHFYYWGLMNYDKSFSLNINDRFQGGGGLGYNISDKKNAAVVLSDGILYEFSDLKIDTARHERYNIMRNSLRLKYHFVWKGIIILDGVHFWQQSLSSGKDYILKSSSGLSVKLKKWLSVTSSLNYNKVNLTSSMNLLFTVGLSADYYF